MMALHPLLVFAVGIFTVTSISAYTDRGSPIRYVAIFLLLANAFVLTQSLNSYSDTRGWAGRTMAGAGFWNVVTLSDRLILRGWDKNNYAQRTNQENEKRRDQPAEGKLIEPPKTALEFGSEVSGNARGIGTFWEVKNVPPFSRTDPKFVPSRASFIAEQAITILATYFVHNWAVARVLNIDRHMLSPKYVPLFGRLLSVSIHELAIRSQASLAYWSIQCGYMQFFYSCAALMTAITNPKDIKLFRPLFGHVRDSFTIRNAWGKTWHQTLRSGLEGTSAFFAHDCLRMARTGLFQRYSKIFFSFLISGIMHVYADAGGGLPRPKSGAMQYFCTQALGIMFEDAVQAVWRRIALSTTDTGRIVARIVGYLWVLAFTIWSSPVWIYPVILEMRQEDAMLGLGAVKPLLFGRTAT